MEAPRPHLFSPLRKRTTTCELPSCLRCRAPAGLTQMEAAAQVHDVRLGVMPPMHSELLLAAEAHERNRNPRYQVRDPQSD